MSWSIRMEPLEASPETDWLRRSTRVPGTYEVVLAHNFTNPLELQAFTRGSTDELGPLQCELVDTPWGDKAIRYKTMGTRLSRLVIESTNGAYETWYIEDGSEWPVAVLADSNTHYVATCDTKTNSPVAERVLIRNGPIFNGTDWEIQVRRTISSVQGEWIGDDGGQALERSVGTAICCVNSEWERPLVALPGSQNGRGVDDPGYGIPTNAGPGNWNAPSVAHASFRGGYWAHTSSALSQMGTSTPGQGTWTGLDGSIPEVSNAWNGDEFYIQFRLRLSASKWAPVDQYGYNQARSGKLFYLQCTSDSSAQQIYLPGGGSGASGSLSVVQDGQTGAQQPAIITSPLNGRDLSMSTTQGKSVQPGGEWEGTCLYGSTGPLVCWQWPVEQWITVLLHIKPSGRNDYQRMARLLTAPGLSPPGQQPNQQLQMEPGQLDDWPDPAEYPYYAELTSGTKVEAVLVTAIDYINQIVHCTRNIRRTDSTFAFPDTAQLQYGACGRADWSGEQRMSYAWLNDPRIAAHKDGLIEVMVALENDSDYTTVFSLDGIPFMYGDGGSGHNDSEYGWYGKNPAGFNSFRMSHYTNTVYTLSGAVSGYSTADYAQLILSKHFIPCPQVAP